MNCSEFLAEFSRHVRASIQGEPLGEVSEVHVPFDLGMRDLVAVVNVDAHNLRLQAAKKEEGMDLREKMEQKMMAGEKPPDQLRTYLGGGPAVPTLQELHDTQVKALEQAHTALSGLIERLSDCIEETAIITVSPFQAPDKVPIPMTGSKNTEIGGSVAQKRAMGALEYTEVLGRRIRELTQAVAL